MALRDYISACLVRVNSTNERYFFDFCLFVSLTCIAIIIIDSQRGTHDIVRRYAPVIIDPWAAAVPRTSPGYESSLRQ